MMKCLIVDLMHDSIHGLLLKIGIEPDYRPEITRSEIIDIIKNYDGLIIRSKTVVDAELIQNADNLKFIGRAGAGIDNLDEGLLKRRNIKILNAPEGNRNALGEHCLGLLLSLLNNIPKSDNEIRQGIWDREGNRGHELAGKTVGLVGFGHMGRSFAEKLKSMDTRIIAYDKYKNNFEDDQVEEVSMEELFKSTDVLSLHVPLTPETKGMVTFNYLEKFNKKIFFINTSRGEVVSLNGLCKALDNGKVIGAGLDVLENEKLSKLSQEEQNSFEYLTNSKKTILTPHVAGWSFESYKRINEVLVDKIRVELNGIV